MSGVYPAQRQLVLKTISVANVPVGPHFGTSPSFFCRIGLVGRVWTLALCGSILGRADADGCGRRVGCGKGRQRSAVSKGALRRGAVTSLGTGRRKLNGWWLNYGWERAGLSQTLLLLLFFFCGVGPVRSLSSGGMSVAFVFGDTRGERSDTLWSRNTSIEPRHQQFRGLSVPFFLWAL